MEAAMKLAEIALHNCFDGTELAALEPFLVRQPGVGQVSIDRTRSVACVSYDPDLASLEDLCALLEQHGYACKGTVRAQSRCQPGRPAIGADDQATNP